MSAFPLALTWAFNSVLSVTGFVLSPEWNDWPWISRVGALLLAPFLWFFAVAGCSADATFRRICLGGGAFFLGGGLLFLVVGGSTWESFRHGASALASGAGLLAAAEVGRAYPVDGPDPTWTKHSHD